MDAAFVEWSRRLFVRVKADEGVIDGLSRECSFAVVTYAGESWIESSDLYTDFRLYMARHYSKGRGCGTEKDFRDRLTRIGMSGVRVRKSSIKVGAGKYPGEPESKIRIARLPSPNDLEEALAEQYPLFMELDPDAEDDD